jgi:hypothetical protein
LWMVRSVCRWCLHGLIHVLMLIACFNPCLDVDCMVWSMCWCSLHDSIHDGSIHMPIMLAWFEPCVNANCMVQLMCLMPTQWWLHCLIHVLMSVTWLHGLMHVFDVDCMLIAWFSKLRGILSSLLRKKR